MADKNSCSSASSCSRESCEGCPSANGGSGIAKEDLPFSFDRYYKVDKVHDRAMSSTGIGLAIVKNVLEAHGATYGVQSEVDVGSIFYFEL